MEEKIRKSFSACHQSSALTNCVSPRAGDRRSSESSFLGQEESVKERLTGDNPSRSLGLWNFSRTV